MEIRQSAFDAIQVVLEGFSFFLRYHFDLDGEERVPESIMFRDNYSTAYFLNATVRDFLVAEETSLTVERTWSIPAKGGIGLGFRLDFPDLPPQAVTLPGYRPAGFPPDEEAGGRFRPFALLGSRTAWPCAAILQRGPRALLLFTDLPERPDDAGGIGLESLNTDEGPLLRLDIRFPPRERPWTATGPRPEDTAPPIESRFPSAGDFHRTHRLHLVTAPAAGIRAAGFEAVLQRCAKGLPVVPVDPNPPRTQDGAKDAPGGRGRGPRGRAAMPPHPVEQALSDLLLREAFPNHLLTEGGVCGLRITPGARELSSSAGAAAALLLLKLTRAPGPDGEPLETALRLADFCLKGQHPGGLFLETFDSKRRWWAGLRGTAHLLDLPASAAVAQRLLLLADELERLGRPADKYRAAGRRAIAAFVDPRGNLAETGGVIDLRTGLPAEAGLGALELAEPLLHLHRREGGESWRKTLVALARRHFPAVLPPLGLPAYREGREPDSRAALLLLRAGQALRQAGIPVPAQAELPSLLYPWIYLNRDGGRDGNTGGGPAAFDPVGGLLDSARRNRLLFQGYEAAFLLWQAGLEEAGTASPARAGSSRLRHPVQDLVRLLTRFTTQAPLGTAWYAHAPWGGPGGRRAGRAGGARARRPADWPRLGPVDARRLTREALFLLRIREECPGTLSAVVLPPP